MKARQGYFKGQVVEEMRRALGQPNEPESFFIWEVMQETGASRGKCRRWLEEQVKEGKWRTARKNGKPSYLPVSPPPRPRKKRVP